MPLILHADVMRESFPGGATYQTLVGDEHGSTPLRLGLQTAPPGYRTRLHSHPYLEVLTVVSGEAEAWSEEHQELVRLVAGTTLVLPAKIKHWFRVVGDEPLKIYGIHASPIRIVDVHREGDPE